MKTFRAVTLSFSLPLLALSAWTSLRAEEGISVPYGSITVGNAVVGRVYLASRDVLKGPFIVVNKGERSLKMTLEFSIPDQALIVPGYEPIPDAGWLTPKDEVFAAEPGQSGGTDFYITIPNDPAL